MADPKLPKLSKAFNPKDENPCEGCSNCCEYISLEIDKPTSAKDFDQIIWFLIHKDVWVYVDEEEDWFIQFNTKCEKLDGRRCGYYVNRPQLCREYQPVDCPRYAKVGEESEKFLFKNEIDLFSFLYHRRPKTFKKINKRIGIPVDEEQLKEKTYIPKYITYV